MSTFGIECVLRDRNGVSLSFHKFLKYVGLLFKACDFHYVYVFIIYCFDLLHTVAIIYEKNWCPCTIFQDEEPTWRFNIVYSKTCHFFIK